MQIPVENVSEYRILSAQEVSLDSLVGEGEDSELGDFIPDVDTKTPEEVLLQKDLRSEILKVMDVLPDREKEVLEKRFGLDSENVNIRTLKEVSK